MPGGAWVIPRQQHRLHSGTLHFPNGFCRVGPQGIGQSHHPDQCSLLCQIDKGTPLVQPGLNKALRLLGHGHTQLLHQRQIACP